MPSIAARPPHAENYPLLFNDAAAAYALALRWKVSCDDAYAGKAIDRSVWR